MKRTLLKSLTTFLVLAVLSGCGGYSYYDAEYHSSATTQKTNRLITELRSKRIGDMMHASITLSSRWHSAKTIEYQFSWFDKDGFQVGEISAWTPKTLYPGRLEHIQSVAPNPSATDYQVSIRVK